MYMYISNKKEYNVVTKCYGNARGPKGWFSG